MHPANPGSSVAAAYSQLIIAETIISVNRLDFIMFCIKIDIDFSFRIFRSNYLYFD